MCAQARARVANADDTRAHIVVDITGIDHVFLPSSVPSSLPSSLARYVALILRDTVFQNRVKTESRTESRCKLLKKLFEYPAACIPRYFIAATRFALLPTRSYPY